MKVSVVLPTYNHQAFIAQALDSVLMQQTSFAYEVIVSEDCSTDLTRTIVQDYAQRHPDRVRLILSETNLHSNEVVARGFANAKGEYVALLDGDDFWLSPHKLQTQASFLDSHPECSMCFHNAAVVTGKLDPDSRKLWTAENHRRAANFADIAGGNFIATSSTMFRRKLVPEIPRWYFDFFPITDWPLYLLFAERGPIGYVDDVLAAYRLHDGGLFSPLTHAKKLESIARFYRRIDSAMDHRHAAQFGDANFRYFVDWAWAHAQRGEVGPVIECLRYSTGLGVAPALKHLPELSILAAKALMRSLQTATKQSPA